MKMKSTAIAAITLLAGLASNGAAFAATASGSSSAEIVTAIAISSNATLNFGQIAPSGTAGTVTISTAGVRSSAGGVTLGNQVTVAAGTFDVTGAANNTYSITLPADGTVTLTSGASPAMAVGTFVSNPASTGTLSAGGAQTLAVGATLSVGVNQPNGTYTGTFPVTVAYN